MIDGKLYMFGGKGSRDAFMLDVPRNMALANKYWSEEVNGSNAFFQRAKRMMMRVPHYKSGRGTGGGSGEGEEVRRPRTRAGRRLRRCRPPRECAPRRWRRRAHRTRGPWSSACRSRRR